MATTGFDIFQGFSERANADRRIAEEANQRREQQELAILQTLSQSDNDEIKAQAWAGLLNFADPRAKRKGLAGYIGETEGHPALKGIAALLRPSTTDTSINYQNGVAAQPGAGGEIRTPPGQAGAGAAAQPAASPVQGGTMGVPAASVNPQVTAPSHAVAPPPPAPTSTTQVQTPTATAGLAGPPPNAPQRPATTTRSRTPFISPEERHLRNTTAKAQGDVEGEVAGLISAGFTDAEARALIKEKYERNARGGAVGNQSIAGEVPDGKGGFMPAFGVFDRRQGIYTDPNTGEPIAGFRPRTTTGSKSFGTDREAIAKAEYGRPFSQLTQEEAARVDQLAIGRAQDVSYARGTGTGQAQNETKMAAPLTPEMAAQQGLPVGSSMASFEGLVPISAEQRGRIDAAKALAPQIDQMDALIQRVFPPSAGLVGGITAAAVLAQKKLSRDPEIEQLDALVNLSLGNVARVLAAESGRLTEQDAIRARSALVDLKTSLVNGDTQETAIAKVRVVQDALRRIGQDLRSPGQIKGTEKEIPSPGGGGPPPPAPAAAPTAQATPPPAAPGAAPAPAPANTAGIASVGAVVYAPDGKRGVVREILPDGKMRVAWEK